ncbi:MAG: FkbM family methyltransferase [Ruminococcaceae bacterium]|nr:FkbM family methyltransferase [Oscillospiraceae bacterium]
MDIWNYLKETERPILLYGMGNGADKILNVFDRYGIKISGIFASDGFVRGNIFHGFKIVSYSEIINTVDDPIIILGFASHRNDVIELINSVNEKHELYAPDVPVYGDTLFSYEFFKENHDNIIFAKGLLHDAESVRIFDEVIDYKLDGKISHLMSAVSDKNEIFDSILSAKNIKSYADLGAYRGDTIEELISYGAKLDKIYAFEPDAKTFKKLSKFCESFHGSEIFNLCAYDRKCKVSFGTEGNRGSSVEKNVSQTHTKETDADSLDNVLQGRNIDYVKYDVEGSEYEALIGSIETIKRCRPKLCVSLYHRSEDIFKLINLVHTIEPSYKLYVRRFNSIPAWDLNLYAI